MFHPSNLFNAMTTRRFDFDQRIMNALASAYVVSTINSICSTGVCPSSDDVYVAVCKVISISEQSPAFQDYAYAFFHPQSGDTSFIDSYINWCNS